MLDIWHAAAPAVDAFAPDIYVKDFKGVCADFIRPFNPLIVPESSNVFHSASVRQFGLANSW
jgi:hypothetical protein